MDDCFFRLGISVQEDGLSWNESSSRKSKGRCQSADAPQGTKRVIRSESDILPCCTPKRHKSKPPIKPKPAQISDSVSSKELTT